MAPISIPSREGMILVEGQTNNTNEEEEGQNNNINMNNNNSNSPSSSPTSNNAPSEILHRIASYLSINDAESMSVGGSYYSLSNRTAPQSRQSSTQYPLVRSSQHSLDYVYQSSNRSRVSPLAANTPRHAHPTNNNSNYSTINNNNRENNLDSPYNNQDEEDWFVGGQHSINSSLGGGTGTSLSLVGGGATPHPGFVTLMPLEEEFDNNNNNIAENVQGNNHAGGTNLSSKLFRNTYHTN